MNIDEVVEVFNVLERLMLDIPDLIQKRWQARSIGPLSARSCALRLLRSSQPAFDCVCVGNMITDLLAYDNRFKIRLRGLELLLNFIDILKDASDQAILSCFADTINFVPFCDVYPKVKPWFQSRSLFGQSVPSAAGPDFARALLQAKARRGRLLATRSRCL